MSCKKKCDCGCGSVCGSRGGSGCGCLTNNDLIALGLVLGCGVIFYSCFDEGLFATVIVVLLILCLGGCC